MEAYRMKTLDPKFKGAVISIMDELLHLNKLNFKKFNFRVLNERLFTSQSCWAFPKNSYLTESFNEKLDRFAENGLIDFMISKYMDPQYLRIRDPKLGPRKLNSEQLLGSFQLWFGGLFIACVFFGVELAAKRFKLIFVHKILKALM